MTPPTPGFLTRSWLVATVALAAVQGCASAPAFSTRFPDNRPDQVDAMMARLSTAPAEAVEGIAVGISPAPTQLYAYDLRAHRVLWRHTASVSHEPMLAGPRVVTQEGSQVVGRDLKSGQSMFSLGAGGMTLNGAAGSGPYTVVVLTSGTGINAKSRVVLMRDGAQAWTHDAAAQAGVPAISGDLVLVPWSGQFLSALDLTTGDELSRIRVKDGVISHAFIVGGQAYIGSRYGYAALDRTVGRGSMKAGRYLSAPERELPGRPMFLRDAYDATPVPAAESAQHRIRLEWEPTISPDKARLQDGLLYLVFYRLVFALEQDTQALRWVYTHDSDIVGAAAQPGGLAFADEGGVYGFLAAGTGTPSWSEPSGIPSAVAVLPTAGAEVPGAASGTPDPAAIRRQLLLAAQDPDARLVPVRVLAVDLLASLSDPAVTGDLVGLCDDERTSPAVRKQACDALQQRQLGTEYVLKALERHYGYLEGTTSPPVGALAKAAAARKITAAVPLLISQLDDPNLPSEELPLLVQAIGQLGEKSAIAPLSDFLRLYHADPVDEYVVKALEAAALALADLAGPVATDTLSDVANDPLTIAGVRDKSMRAWAALDAQADAAEKRQQTELASQEQKAEAQAEAEQEPPMPERLTLDVVSRALLPVRDELRACLDQGGHQHFRARVVVVVENGKLLMASVNPRELEPCMTPLVRAQQFPETKYAKREQVTYTVRRN